jgi:hypothetical protein
LNIQVIKAAGGAVPQIFASASLSRRFPGLHFFAYRPADKPHFSS